jgi:hypothetical protein
VGWRDRAIGIVLGVALGAGIVVAFVFALSDQTVDAPSLSGEMTDDGNRGQGGDRAAGRVPPTETIRVIGGVPPPSGPAQLDYRRGDLVRLRIVSDLAVELELTGYELRRSVPANSPKTIEFEASRAGTFGLIVADSQIDVARITVSGAG